MITYMNRISELDGTVAVIGGVEFLPSTIGSISKKKNPIGQYICPSRGFFDIKTISWETSTRCLLKSSEAGGRRCTVLLIQNKN